MAKRRAIATVGLRLLSNLHSTVPQLQRNPSLDFVTCLALFTDETDPWTTLDAFNDAHHLLIGCECSCNDNAPRHARDLIRRLLEQRVKPLFARTKNPSITKQGRKAISSLPASTDFSETEVEVKPWKFQGIHIITVFRWILAQLDVHSLLSITSLCRIAHLP